MIGDKVKILLRELLIILATVVMLVPIYYFVISAFKTRQDIVFYPLRASLDMLSFENFKVALSKVKYFEAMKNTAIITVVSMLIIILCSSMAGFVLARLKGKLFSSYSRFVVALMVLPFMACLLPMIILLNRAGMFNSLWAPIIIQVAWHLPFSVFLYTGFVRGIPHELEEAAIIDGCGLWSTYWRVFLPLLGPVTGTCCIRCGIGIWQDFVTSSTFLNSAKSPTVMVSINKFFGQYVDQYGQAFAAVLLFSIPTIILFLSMQKYFIKGINAGAVKG